MKNITCPKCGKHLTADDGMEKVFCTYCGEQIQIQSPKQTRKITCPHCVAPIEITDDMKTALCSYCGAEIDLSKYRDSNITQTNEVSNDMAGSSSASQTTTDNKVQESASISRTNSTQNSSQTKQPKVHLNLFTKWAILAVSVFLILLLVPSGSDAKWGFLLLEEGIFIVGLPYVIIKGIIGLFSKHK